MIVENNDEGIRVAIEKSAIPIVYLDSNIIIELKRIADRTSSNKYKADLQTLYEMLSVAMKHNLIICPSGNQHDEIALSETKKENEEFLFRFTNSELLDPVEIKNKQTARFFEAFQKRAYEVQLSSSEVLARDHYPELPYQIRIGVTMPENRLEEIRAWKGAIVDVLNRIRKEKLYCPDFDTQLGRELLSDADEIARLFKKWCRGDELTRGEFDSLQNAFLCMGYQPYARTNISQMARYLEFLRSVFYFRMPYIWIERNLLTNLLLGNRPVQSGDYYDAMNAASYLPYVDAFITDISFCETLKKLGFDKKYKTKVYSMRTIMEFMDDFSLCTTSQQDSNTCH